MSIPYIYLMQKNMYCNLENNTNCSHKPVEQYLLKLYNAISTPE